ncbi:Ubiquitin carboxyl-terminal hydrolase isozyme L3 [Blyttiomyces sp. JEL0837]|nr:Ubiquitin carboxyl-terminal hydrolase isozyme L3 [Blyttiomyces sp. JEL0837]
MTTTSDTTTTAGKKDMWLPLEANPEYIQRLGVSTQWEYTDVWGLDEDALQFVRRPVAAVLLLFPVTEKYEAFRKEEETRITTTGQVVSPSLYFVKQTIGNACGTIALLHSLINNKHLIDIGTGALSRILSRTLPMTPDQRAQGLESDMDLAQIHEESSMEGQSHVPDRDEDVDLHFVSFVGVDGSLYELDGRKPWPVNHGKCEDLLVDAVKVVKTFMEREPDQLNFTVIALTPAEE